MFILYELIKIYIDIVILDVLLSWVILALPNVAFLFTLQRFLDALVRPLLNPISNVLRPYQRGVPLDFSPLILILGLELIQNVLIGMMNR